MHLAPPTADSGDGGGGGGGSVALGESINGSPTSVLTLTPTPTLTLTLTPTLTPTFTPTLTLTLTLTGEPVDGSPASVLVVGGPCHAPSCVLSGPALRGAPGEALTISAAERVV